MGLFHSRFAVPAHQDGNDGHWGSLLASCGQCPYFRSENSYCRAWHTVITPTSLCWKGCPYRDNGVQPDANRHQNSLLSNGTAAITRLVREIAHVGVTESLRRPPQARAAGPCSSPLIRGWLSTAQPQALRSRHGTAEDEPVRGQALVVRAGALVAGPQSALGSSLITTGGAPDSSPAE